MAETYKNLGQSQIPNAPTVIYTVPALTQAIAKFMNVSSPETNLGAATVKIWKQGAVDANLILPAISLGIGEFAEWDGTMTMEAGDTLQAESDTNNALTITIDGVEIT